MNSLEPEVFANIAHHLDAADRARLSMTCKAASEGCRTQKGIHATLPKFSKHRGESFLRWFFKRLDVVEELVLHVNILEWNFLWRYCGIHVAKNLKRVVIVDAVQNFNGICLASLEEVLPICPALEYLSIKTEALHLGTGFSRMHAKKLVLDCVRVTSDPMAWMIPTLECAIFTGYTMDVYMNGLSLSKLTCLEGEANLLLGVVPMLTHLETLVLDASKTNFHSVDTVTYNTTLSCPLKNVHLQGGEWLALQWLPSTVQNIEFMFCFRGVGALPHPVKTLTVVCSSLTPAFVKYAASNELDHFRYESCGLPLQDILRVNARSVYVPRVDASHVVNTKVR